MYLNSGQMKAFPAYDPSTCSHTLFALQMGPISSRRSNAQHPKIDKTLKLLIGKIFDLTVFD